MTTKQERPKLIVAVGFIRTSAIMTPFQRSDSAVSADRQYRERKSIRTMHLTPRILYVVTASVTGSVSQPHVDAFCREMQNSALDVVKLQLSEAPDNWEQTHQQLRTLSLGLQTPLDDMRMAESNLAVATDYLQVLRPDLLIFNQLDEQTATLVLAARQLLIPWVLDVTACDAAELLFKAPIAKMLLKHCQQVWVNSARQRQLLIQHKVPAALLHAIAVRWNDQLLTYTVASTRQLWQLLRQRYQAEPAVSPDSQQLRNKSCRIVAIMDEFTRGCFEPEATLLHLKPEDVVGQLEAFQPQLFFIESAWKGVDDSWKMKVSNRATELMLAIAWCRLHQVPVIFWNKEDPVHFSTFLPVAAAADYVFTTDVDCVPRYKQALGHDQVSMLPFAAQTKQHNPLELFERKDAFNFAGSYYLRYPERQRDFAALIDTVKQFRPVDIYDRNHENPHPHYQFPEQYKPMILGSLPFEQIDKAYKGYRYGINMNTIKQSQTMFARRVFELLASNTVVVSNFSRGVRTLFGDLVICSDDAGQLQQRLTQVCADETSYRKFRLLGLRKVMQQHTYRHRLAYICSKVFTEAFLQQEPCIWVFAQASNEVELQRIRSSFQRQTYSNTQLIVYCSDASSHQAREQHVHNLTVVGDKAAAEFALQQVHQQFGYCAFFNANDYYGPNYLLDLVHGFHYSDAVAVGKRCYFLFSDGVPKLQSAGTEYRQTDSLCFTRSMLSNSLLDQTIIQRILSAGNEAVLPGDIGYLLAVDEFNYCAAVGNLDADAIAAVVDDMKLANQGADLNQHIYPAAELLPAAQAQPSASYSSVHVLELDSAKIWQLIKTRKPAGITTTFERERVSIVSSMAMGKHCYIYLDKNFSREELNLVNNSQFKLDIDRIQGDVRTVFEFLDVKGKKLSHSINKDPGQQHALAIPANCQKVRVGFRIEGPAEMQVNRLVLGSVPERPASILGNSDTLVLTKQYPAYDDLYRYGFLHSRIRAYREAGKAVDIFRLAPELVGSYREFENIDIANGDFALLDTTLAQGRYRHVLVHMLDNKMWDVLNKHIETVRVTVWVHGAEIQSWQRRSFEFENMTPTEVERQKKLCINRNKFWQKLMTNPHQNLNLVFVSHTFLHEVETDLQMKMPEQHVSVIHNHIDTKIFKYHEKTSEQRLKILSIRSFASRKYANDLTVAAIELLAKKPYFNELSFLLIGDGMLFDAVVEPIRQYPNVTLERKFVTHYEIARIQQDYGVFLNPTRWDSQGVSRDEAMASGLVPVTTAVAAVPEFVDAESGFVVPAEDAQGLADAIDFLYHHPEDFLRLSKAAAERVNRQCSFGKTITKEMLMLN